VRGQIHALHTQKFSRFWVLWDYMPNYSTHKGAPKKMTKSDLMKIISEEAYAAMKEHGDGLSKQSHIDNLTILIKSLEGLRKMLPIEDNKHARELGIIGDALQHIESYLAELEGASPSETGGFEDESPAGEDFFQENNNKDGKKVTKEILLNIIKEEARETLREIGPASIAAGALARKAMKKKGPNSALTTLKKAFTTDAFLKAAARQLGIRNMKDAVKNIEGLKKKREQIAAKKPNAPKLDPYLQNMSVDQFYKQQADQAVYDADQEAADQQSSAQQASQGDINNPNQGEGPTRSKASEMKIKQGLAKMTKQLEKSLETLKALDGLDHGESSTPEVTGIFDAIEALKSAVRGGDG
jgi:NACalpha-BTF3-like transcription factor